MKSFMDDNFLLTTETSQENCSGNSQRKCRFWIIIVILILKKLQRIRRFENNYAGVAWWRPLQMEIDES